jgi:hypothetical protein
MGEIDCGDQPMEELHTPALCRRRLLRWPRSGKVGRAVQLEQGDYPSGRGSVCQLDMMALVWDARTLPGRLLSAESTMPLPALSCRLWATHRLIPAQHDRAAPAGQIDRLCSSPYREVERSGVVLVIATENLHTGR